ncbi:MAG: Protein GrpE [Alphaproteobacteria bacterium MarineAlpha3_Bin5]|nr:nucleotide exchange factor GrpE [Magnetovibrio sp.]PPR77746.1 MAG: Protein GrpE [Alphaproteobacteria bacterium MarineAlpha3_Bin5]
MKKQEKLKGEIEKMSNKKFSKDTETKNTDKEKDNDQPNTAEFDDGDADKSTKTFTPSSEKNAELHLEEKMQNNAETLSDVEGMDETDQIANLEVELVEVNDKLLRALAEAENVRRRAIRDREEFSKRANANFAKEILPVADNIHRALDNIDDQMLSENETYSSFVEGIKIIEKTIISALNRQNVQAMEAEGKKFDPRFHEAMFEYEDSSQPTGSVGQVLEVGYTINGLLLRPAKVGVTKGGPEDPKEISNDGGAEPNQFVSEAYEDDNGGPGSKVDEEL